MITQNKNKIDQLEQRTFTLESSLQLMTNVDDHKKKKKRPKNYPKELLTGTPSPSLQEESQLLMSLKSKTPSKDSLGGGDQFEFLPTAPPLITGQSPTLFSLDQQVQQSVDFSRTPPQGGGGFLETPQNMRIT
jgi:hypothetical protein